MSFFLLSLIMKNISSQNVGEGGKGGAGPPWPPRAPTVLYKYVICHMIKQTFIQVFVYKCQSLSQCFTTLWAWNINCVSSVRIRSYSCPDFSACRLNSVRMMENADQNNSEYGHFLRNDLCWFFWMFWCWKHQKHSGFLQVWKEKSPYSVRIRESTDQKKLRIWTLFMQWLIYAATVI